MRFNPSAKTARFVAILFAIVSFTTLATGSTLPPGFAEQEIATGLDPTAMEMVPDGSGRIFVIQKSGAVRVVKSDILLTTPFTTVAADNFNERGLCGIAFHPDYATDPNNRWVYLYFTVLNGSAGADTNTRLVRIKASGTNPDIAEGVPETLLNLDSIGGGSIHQGGSMFFREGKLYICTGDGGLDTRSQSLTSLMGKVLRLNADGSIPTDNPFYSTLTGNSRAIYAMGLRNPFSFNLQVSTGKVYMNDVGGNAPAWESIEELTAGANYGWPAIHQMKTAGQTAPTVGGSVYKDPMYVYPTIAAGYGYDGHGNGFAIAGGVFYNPTVAGGGRFPPQYNGLYFFGDYAQRWVKTFNPVTKLESAFATNTHRPLSFKITPSGTLYMLTRGAAGNGNTGDNTTGAGSIWKVFYSNTSAPSIASEPQNQSSAIGQTVSFSVSVSGVAPFTYKWQKNGVDISGATTTSSSTTNTYTLSNLQISDNNAQFRCIVSNTSGSVTSIVATLAVNSRPLPVPTITSPSENYLWSGGDVISFSGSATDSVDGTLAPANLTWSVEFIHDTHSHPVIGATSGITSGTFPVSRAEHGIVVSYRISLTAANSAGLTNTVSRVINPKFINVKIDTQPSGLKVKVDSVLYATPFNYTSIAGMERAVEAESSQGLNGEIYSFDSWSNDQSAAHTFRHPQFDTTLKAWYKPSQSGGITRDYWLNAAGTSLSQLTALTTYPNSPSGTAIVTSLAGPSSWADNYGARFSGLIKPPSNGNYTFHLSASDMAELKLSNTSSSLGATSIATISSDGNSEYEGFNYVVGAIAGKGVASAGWSGAWTGSGEVVSEGLTYVDANSVTMPVSGNRIVLTEQTAFRARTSAVNSGTIWVSFLGNSTGGGYAGVSLYDSSNEKLFIGKRSNQLNWGIDFSGNGANSTIAAAANTFIVCRIDFGAGTGGSANAYLWTNPRLGPVNEPTIGTAAAQLLNLGAFGFNNIRATSGNSVGAFTFDELRLGSTYSKVAPTAAGGTVVSSSPIALQSGQSYYVEATHKAGIGADNFTVTWTGPSVANNSAISGSMLAPLYTAPSLITYVGWRTTHFSGFMANESRSGFNASFLNDGVSNGIKYALGINPTVAMPVGSLPQGTVSAGVLSLTYRKDSSLGVNYLVEASTGLNSGSWSNTGITETVLSTQGTTQQVKASIPNNTAQKRFLRLGAVNP